jgi:hypothetical protein
MSNPGVTYLQSYWKLNETSGTRVDSDGSNPLSAQGVGYQAGRRLFIGNCADFDANNEDQLTSSDSFNLLQGGNFPICIGLWIKPRAAATTAVILAKYGATNAEYEILILNSKIRFTIRDANDANYTVDADTFGMLCNDMWYFIGAYFDSVANEIGVCVNDVWDTTPTGIYGIATTTEDFYLGTWGGQSAFYDGLMDEVFFYKNRLLTEDEWTWLYNSDYGRRYEDLSQVAPPSVDIVTERKIPEIYVYDQDLTFLGIIENYSSLNWAERYNSEGDFELELPLTYSDSSLLALGNFLYIPTSDKIMIVEERKPTRTPTDGKLLVNGRSVESVLRRRMQMQLHTWFAPAEYIAYHHVYYSSIGSGFPKRIIDLFEDGSGDTWPPAMESSVVVSEQFDSESIYEVIETVLKIADLGFKIIVANLALPSPKIYFLVYEGLDRSNDIIFSDTFDNLLDSSFLITQEGKINVTQVVTDDDVYERVFVWEGGSTETDKGTEPEGLNRFEGRLETNIDRVNDPVPTSPVTTPPIDPTLGVGESSQNDFIAIGITVNPTTKISPSSLLTDEEVLGIIEERGEVVIKENTPIDIFDGDVDARTQFVIDEDFFLGDIVQVYAHGISDAARIIEVVKSYSVEGERVYLAFDFEV